MTLSLRQLQYAAKHGHMAKCACSDCDMAKEMATELLERRKLQTVKKITSLKKPKRLHHGWKLLKRDGTAKKKARRKSK